MTRWFRVRWQCVWRFRAMRVLCWLHGHDDWRIVERGTGVHLLCLTCGRKTEGWTLDAPGPTPTQPGDRARHRMVNKRHWPQWRKRA